MMTTLDAPDGRVTSVRLSCTARTLTVVDGRIEADLTTVEITELQRAGYTDTPHIDAPISDATPVPAPTVTGL